jgi:hypothetical protein
VIEHLTTLVKTGGRPHFGPSSWECLGGLVELAQRLHCRGDLGGVGKSQVTGLARHPWGQFNELAALQEKRFAVTCEKGGGNHLDPLLLDMAQHSVDEPQLVRRRVLPRPFPQAQWSQAGLNPPELGAAEASRAAQKRDLGGLKHWPIVSQQAVDFRIGGHARQLAQGCKESFGRL